ncbi:hypothetical protein OG345_41795 (plasmid) [Streptomyces sp. NBC_01220]|uniref:hypothetical protein n=1 Tax=Streptomyces sp. NBC_01220 TaxID=2903781 RepID=UPI00352DE0C5|nr:hypothetical protein OG345_41795 [Streptomyces sp. NBC_01220]
MQLNRQACLTLQQEGKAAYQAGDPADSSPYNRVGNAEQQFGHRYWMRGWSMARSETEDAKEQPTASTGH